MRGVRPNSPMHATSVEPRQLARAEVVEQRREGRVERAHELLRPLEVVLVRVPAVEHHLDELHAALDEAPRHEAPATEVGVAVGARVVASLSADRSKASSFGESIRRTAFA